MTMKWEKWPVYIIALTVMILTSSDSWALSKRDLRRKDSRGAVTVIATYLNPLGKESGNTLNIEVRLETHSVDLDGVAVDKLAVLRGTDGVEVHPLGWFEPGGGGHHRFGILRFPIKDSSGNALLPGGKGRLELRIRGIADPSTRVFQWHVSPPTKKTEM